MTHYVDAFVDKHCDCVYRLPSLPDVVYDTHITGMITDAISWGKKTLHTVAVQEGGWCGGGGGEGCAEQNKTEWNFIHSEHHVCSIAGGKQTLQLQQYL